MAGRKPKPTNIKLLEGNPGKRPLPTREPKPPPIAPECPSWLHKNAKKEWKRIVPQLERMGLLTQVDMAALAGYCEAWAMYMEAMSYLHKNGQSYLTVLRDESGNIVLNDKGEQVILKSSPWPEASIAHKSLMQVRAFCSEFGLTPSSRARMSVPGADDKDDGMEELLSGVKPSVLRPKQSR